MSRATYISSSVPLSVEKFEGVTALSPFVLRYWPARDVESANVDVNELDDPRSALKLFLADMDSTMIGQECIDELADYAGVKEQVANVTERAMQGELDFEEALRARVALLKGLPETALQACYEERIRPNEGAQELLAALGRAGIYRVLVSGGFTFFASRIAQRLGFDEFHANVLGIKDGVLTGEVKGAIVGAATKAEVLVSNMLRMGINAEQTAAIGDGANDLAMISASGIGVAYRAKPVLREAAQLKLDHSHLDALVPILGLDL